MYAANQKISKPSEHTNYGKSTFKFSPAKIWKSVPPELKILNLLHTCSSKSGINDFYWTLKTDHSLTVSYIL